MQWGRGALDASHAATIYHIDAALHKLLRMGPGKKPHAVFDNQIKYIPASGQCSQALGKYMLGTLSGSCGNTKGQDYVETIKHNQTHLRRSTFRTVSKSWRVQAM